jgi:FtsP/CotA-like multicopper oxidase with cupredoxin domain
MKPGVAALTLLTVNVTKDAATAMDFIPEANAPTFPSFLEDVTDAELSGTKIITFASESLAKGFPAQHYIDGKKFDGEVGAVVALNHAEEWKIVNETYPPSTGNQISHPFHIHINPFQVTELFDPNAALSSAVGPGTVSTTTGASTVTGSSDTTFLTTFKVGDFIWINGEPPATVLSIQGDNALTFSVAAAGTTGGTYSVAVPLYTIDRPNARAGQCVLDPADPNSWKPCRAIVPTTNRIWWDVFPIPSGNNFPTAAGTTTLIPGYFKMRSRFVDYSGYYVLHCHILAHEDRGMMTVVEVAPIQTPYSHH